MHRGHRAPSFIAEDVDELVELRARQRTFDGAYARTALGNLGYSLTILRMFERSFYRIGILYAALAASLFVVAFLRARYSRHDFADIHQNAKASLLHLDAAPTRGQENKRVFGRPFVTAGSFVILVAGLVAMMQIFLVVLILQLRPGEGA
ncbi:hypothetical protein FA95DRAFT_1482504 [Auriscalpium vulgare]|uniref:Uncharacterized protein n=1 Tax=Auriscalpium vulgare TaxID=40419 RepID=A0ACB8SAC7_9AGAM|nr:hypothetical protein FA95DRAFT_1482504 [Auriscalpium vulgare]